MSGYGVILLWCLCIAVPNGFTFGLAVFFTWTWMMR